ncbi:response regulator transcription factor [Helcococcus ovis]|uniref:Response regulator transcription factor n=3 Tax=Helcococcus ovis TaxID=72026 RepID=A0A4R9BZN8_9FIRM|nr:response regulator transcription factor [Helcococcus ovis]TFF64263.1 response regulator transcription factor [Helcococcus ovis]TFF64436.1 response regulator transcription factor [Helcococcus ovis]TFF67378.1 response regulator transcription factor [Helcococcus ovis]WNZ02059.1 response regulator transcription factor [Helcococcus ovis]
MLNKVLLVEDEVAIRKFTKINVQKAGFEVYEAGSGEEGIEMALDIKPDVVILDVMLPGMNGFEVCSVLRNEMPDLGIIMLTAKSQDVDRILGLEQGSDDYMTKPFNPQELVLRIKSLVRRINLISEEEHKDDNLSYGPFKIDSYSKKFTKNGQIIELTPTELSLMKIFLTNKDKAFTREELMDLAWGNENKADTKIIDVNIRRIRAKIEDSPANPKYLHTVWGVGYRWGN